LKWVLQKDALPVTTSGDTQRQKEQLNYNDPPWKLSDSEMGEIDIAGLKAPFRKFWRQRAYKDVTWDS
jgi:diketogulonate reductase-like aldo/keto reductase